MIDEVVHTTRSTESWSATNSSEVLDKAFGGPTSASGVLIRNIEHL